MSRLYRAGYRYFCTTLAASVWLVMGHVALAWATEIDAESSPINWWTWDAHAPPMGWFLLDFGLFLAALIYLTARPLAQSFAERHAAIKKAIADAAAAHAKASLAQAEARQKLASLEVESRELLQTSLRDGQAERAQMVHDADEYARRMKADTSSLADQELKRARLRLQGRTMRATLSRTATLLQADLDQDDQRRLLDAGIDAMGDDANWRLKPLHAGAPNVAQVRLEKGPI